MDTRSIGPTTHNIGRLGYLVRSTKPNTNDPGRITSPGLPNTSQYCDILLLPTKHIIPQTNIMPRTPKKSSARNGPYASPASSSSEDHKPKIRTPTKGTAWTAHELKTLLHFALDRNGRSWGEAVPGRTTSQASQTWRWAFLSAEHVCEDDC